MTEKPQRILLGEITTVHGVKGEVVIRSYTAEPEDVASYGPLTDEAGTRTFEIVALRPGSKGLLARLKGIEDRTAAEALRGTMLYIGRDALPEPENTSEFYIADLVGLRALTDDGTELGTVTTVHNFGAGDLIEIALSGQRVTELVPFTDACVPHVDLAGGTVTVRLPLVTEGDEPSGDNDDEAPSA